jgi:hypothetical protein
MIEMLVKYKKEREMSVLSDQQIRENLKDLTDDVLEEMIEGLRPV